MSLTLAISLIVLADIVLIAGLSYMMSRAGLLTPHLSHHSAIAQPAVTSHDRASAARRSTRRTHARATGQPVEA